MQKTLQTTKLLFEKFAIYLLKITRKVRLERKIKEKQTNKQTNKQ